MCHHPYLHLLPLTFRVKQEYHYKFCTRRTAVYVCLDVYGAHSVCSVSGGCRYGEEGGGEGKPVHLPSSKTCHVIFIPHFSFTNTHPLPLFIHFPPHIFLLFFFPPTTTLMSSLLPTRAPASLLYFLQDDLILAAHLFKHLHTASQSKLVRKCVF